MCLGTVSLASSEISGNIPNMSFGVTSPTEIGEMYKVSTCVSRCEQNFLKFSDSEPFYYFANTVGKRHFICHCAMFSFYLLTAAGC